MAEQLRSQTTRDRPRHRRRHRADVSPSNEFDEIPLESIPSPSNSQNSTTVLILPSAPEPETVEESPLIKIIQKKKKKDWAKLVAPVDENKIKKKKESIGTRVKNLFAKVPSPIEWLLDKIEHKNGYAIRSYFQFIVWLFYLNLFNFLLCFCCIILPTFIYRNPIEFIPYALEQFYPLANDTVSFSVNNESYIQCNLNDRTCLELNGPVWNSSAQNLSHTCLNNPITASVCCSFQTEQFFIASSQESRTSWTKFLTDLIDGTGLFTVNRLFIGYYRNLTRTSDDQNSHSHIYNMGLAVFLTGLACLIITGIVIVRQYGDGMKTSYVQNESFQSDLFPYIFARWNHRIMKQSVARRHEQRFRSELINILLENKDKNRFKFESSTEAILFKIRRLAVWLVTLLIFAGAIAAVYFTNRFAFEERARKEMAGGTGGTNRARDLAIEYLPTTVITVINLASQLAFSYMRDFKLYTRTTDIRHYLIRVTIMRLLLLVIFMFVVILQITCNSNPCAKQSELIDCAGISGQSTFTHCWENVIGQSIYRLVITDTAVMVIIHLVVDPIRSLLRYCCCPRTVIQEDDGTTIANYAAPDTWCLFQPLEFEVEDYVLDLTYTQTLCWHGFLFCPFLPLIAAAKNIIIFAVKLLSLAFFRRRSKLELSPARARYIFTSVLLFSFVWALLPIAFLATSLRPSRGCSPFRLYSDEPDYYIYYSFRNTLSQIQSRVLLTILLKITSAVVVIPLLLILILISCIVTIRRNSYRAASVELYKLLYSSQTTHQLALRRAPVVVTSL